MKDIYCCVCSTLIAIMGTNGFLLADESKSATSAAQSTETSADAKEISLCTKEILMTFFPRPIVKDVLVKQGISTDRAEIIAQELSSKDQEIVKMVEQKASQMNPNPFKDLSQRDVAIKIFRETLYEVFATVLKNQGITDEKTIHHLLEDMQEAKGKLFVECIRKEAPKEEK